MGWGAADTASGGREKKDSKQLGLTLVVAGWETVAPTKLDKVLTLQTKFLTLASQPPPS